MDIKFLEAFWNSTNFGPVGFKDKNPLDDWMYQLP
jgi:hypothetical protein